MDHFLNIIAHIFVVIIVITIVVVICIIIRLIDLRYTFIYYMADWFRVLWLVNSRSVSSRTDLWLSITFSKPE